MDPAVLKALIKDSQKTKRLDLSHNNLDVVPEEVVKLHHLEKLTLSHNNITVLPSELIKNNPKLIEIDLSYNKLESLPEVDELKDLERFDVSSNRLKTLPSSYVGLFSYRKEYLIRSNSIPRYMSFIRRRIVTHTQYRVFRRTKINCGNNPDLDIDPLMIAEDPLAAQDILIDKGNLEDDAREAEEPIKKAQVEKEKEREVEFNEKRRQARKQNEKERTKSRRLDRH